MSTRLLRSGIEGGIVVAALTVFALLLVRYHVFSGSGSPSDASVGETAELVETITRREVTLTYIGDLGCPVCTDEEYVESLGKLVTSLRAKVRADSALFRAVGVILTEGNERQAYRYLMEAAEWDEVSIGGGGLNTHLQAHVWDRAERYVTPLILVQSRNVHLAPTGDIMMGPPGYPVRIQGGATVKEIVMSEDWVRAIPSLSPSRR